MATPVRPYLIVGDSNCRRFYNKLGLQSNEIDFLEARNQVELQTCLTSLKASYTYVIFSFLSNILISTAEDSSSNQDRLNVIEVVLDSVVTDLWYVRCMLMRRSGLFFISIVLLLVLLPRTWSIPCHSSSSCRRLLCFVWHSFTLLFPAPPWPTLLDHTTFWLLQTSASGLHGTCLCSQTSWRSSPPFYAAIRLQSPFWRPFHAQKMTLNPIASISSPFLESTTSCIFSTNRGKIFLSVNCLF